MNSAPSNFPARRGFTLIEVLATLLVVSIVMPVALKGLSAAVSAATYCRRSVEAATLAEVKLEDLITSGEWQNGSMSGDFSPDYPDYKWTAQAIPRDVDLTEVQIQVTWTQRQQERSVGLATILYTPESGTDSGSGSGMTSGGATGP